MDRIGIADKGFLELVDGILRLSWRAGQTIDAEDAHRAVAAIDELGQGSLPLLILVRGVNFTPAGLQGLSVRGQRFTDCAAGLLPGRLYDRAVLLARVPAPLSRELFHFVKEGPDVASPGHSRGAEREAMTASRTDLPVPLITPSMEKARRQGAAAGLQPGTKSALLQKIGSRAIRRVCFTDGSMVRDGCQDQVKVRPLFAQLSKVPRDLSSLTLPGHPAF